MFGNYHHVYRFERRGDVDTWSVSDTTLATIDNSGTLTSKSAGNVIVTHSVVDEFGCTDTTKDTFSIKTTPRITITPSQTICENSYTLPIVMKSDVSGTTYKWTNSNTSAGLSKISDTTSTIDSFLAVNPLSFTTNCVFTVFSNAGGCAGDTIQDTVTVNPIPVMFHNSPVSLCSGSYYMTFFSSNVWEASYNWSNTDTSIGLPAKGSTGYLSDTVKNTLYTSQTDSMIVTPVYEGCYGKTDTFFVTVNPVPAMSAIVPSSQSICAGSNADTVLFSGSMVSGTVYKWENTDTTIGLKDSGTGNIAAFKTKNTTYAVRKSIITVNPIADGCIGATQYDTLFVKPIPPAASLSNALNACIGTEYNASFSSPVDSVTFNWTNTNSAMGMHLSGSGNFTDTLINNTYGRLSDTLIVIPISRGCDGKADTALINVNPKPTVTLPVSQTICSGNATTFIKFTGPATGTTFNWYTADTATGLPHSGYDSIPATVLMNSTSKPIASHIFIAPYSAYCKGDTVTDTITVNPVPAAVSVTDTALCNNAKYTVSFTGTLSGTVFNWTNTDTAIGLPASGSGNIADTLNNMLYSARTDTLIIIPSANGCSGRADTALVTVKPIPAATISASQVLCAGGSSSPVLLTSTVSGTAYKWTNSNTTTGLKGTDTTSTIPSFTSVNTSYTTQKSVISATPTAAGCIGNAVYDTITVNPIPSAAKVADSSLCSGTLYKMNFTDSVAGTVFNWTNSDTATGLAASGSGNTADTLQNKFYTPHQDTLIITPVASSCYGKADTAVITVNPIPSADTFSSLSICNKTSVSTITFTGSLVSGTHYNWSATDPTIGLHATGTDSISSFVSKNATDTIKTCIITVTPIANGCNGSEVTRKITVYPVPDVVMPPAQIICNGSQTDTVMFTGNVSGTVYNWVNANTSVGLPDTGSGSITPFAAYDTAYIPIHDTITVTPGIAGCTGTPEKIFLTVNPTPVFDQPGDISVCGGSMTPVIYFTGAKVLGTDYKWTNSDTTIGLGSYGTGVLIVSFKAADTSLTVQNTAVVTVTPEANNCYENADTFDITVKASVKTPVISASPASPLCYNTLYQYFSALTPASANEVYKWNDSNATLVAIGTGAQDEIVSFNKRAGRSVIALTDSDVVTGCTASTSSIITVSSADTSYNQSIIYSSNYLTCIGTGDSAYQWGYDRIGTISSVLMPGDTSNSYYTEHPDTAYFFVITYQKGGCMQKTYYTIPPGSRPTEIKTVISNPEIKVYPNPARDVVNIACDGVSGIIVHAMLYDITGRLVMQTDLKNNVTSINIANLSPGMYLLSVFNDNEKLKTFRVIKN